MSETYTRASELLYHGHSAKGQDYNYPASFPLFTNSSFTMNSLSLQVHLCAHQQPQP